MAIRILHLEDDMNDAELIALHLKASGLKHQLTWVKSESEFEKALDGGGFDVILADNTGPTFTGSAALSLAKAKSPQTPFIFLSGTVNPGSISAALQKGAADYLVKDQLAPLVPAIERAVAQS